MMRRRLGAALMTLFIMTVTLGCDRVNRNDIRDNREKTITTEKTSGKDTGAVGTGVAKTENTTAARTYGPGEDKDHIRTTSVSSSGVTSLEILAVIENIEILKSSDDRIHLEYMEKSEDPKRYVLSEKDGTVSIKRRDVLNNENINERGENLYIKAYLPDTAKNLKINTVNGQISIAEGTAVEILDIENTNGGLDIADGPYKNITVTLVNGNVRIDSHLGEKTAITVTNGNVDINVKGKESDFTVTSRSKNTTGGSKIINVTQQNGSGSINFSE